MTAKDRIFCALDVSNLHTALALTSILKPEVGAFKIGLELFLSEGPLAVRKLQEVGADRVFLDLKLHDIPNTVAGAVRAAAQLGVWCLTLHTTGGSAMVRAARDAADKYENSGRKRPFLLGVTVLTSLSQQMLQQELQVRLSLKDQTVHLAKLALENGCDGVVASPLEIRCIREAIPDPNFLIITPGVRPEGSAAGDQARTLTPGEAVREGANYLVIGRPITASADPIAAARSIIAEIQNMEYL